MSLEMQDCLFPNLGIVINMKPTDVFFKFHSRKDNNIVYQKYEPTQSSIYSFVCYQVDIYFYVGLFDE